MPVNSNVSHVEAFMSHFWAKFLSVDDKIFRLDTRIYLHEIDTPNEDDSCIGAIVGKNPGSAKPSTSSSFLQPIELDGDKLLPTVRNVITKAYLTANTSVPDRGYVQVLNLFYLCDPNLSEAISSISNVAAPPLCTSEANGFPWVWYVWGDKSAGLDLHKERFSQIKANQHFFFDPQANKVIDHCPRNDEFAI